MKGITIFSKLYDALLFTYLYVWIVIDQKIDQFVDFRANVKWIRKNGPYNG